MEPDIGDGSKTPALGAATRSVIGFLGTGLQVETGRAMLCDLETPTGRGLSWPMVVPITRGRMQW